MLNRLEKELNEIIENQIENKGKELPMDKYREITSEWFEKIRTEKRRIIEKEGTIARASLREGNTYRIEDLASDMMKEALIKHPTGLYITIVPRYITKYKYIAYTFKKIDEENAILEKKVNHR